MTAEEFIKINVRYQLEEEGYGEEYILFALSQAVTHYRECSVFKRWKVVKQCLDYAKKITDSQYAEDERYEE